MFTPTLRLLNYAMQKFIPSLIIALALLLDGCVSMHRTRPVYGDTSTLAALKALSNVKGNKKSHSRRKKTSKIRTMALKEIALSLGAQAALAWRAKAIDMQLTRQARRLDTIYDFNSLILEHNILPPVLLEGRNTFNLADTQTIRISDRTYRVAKQARFITTPPTWRQYLWLDYQSPECPHIAMLPKTREERRIWCFYVEKGWKNGLEQASIILEESIARLKEDYTGMVRYRKLLAMNMISPPYVANTDLGVTGDESEMHIDDRVLRITALPLLNINSKEWRAAVSKDENVLEQYKTMEKRVLDDKIAISSNAWQPIIAPINDHQPPK